MTHHKKNLLQGNCKLTMDRSNVLGYKYDLVPTVAHPNYYSQSNKRSRHHCHHHKLDRVLSKTVDAGGPHDM